MTDLATFCGRLGVDEAAARAALDSEAAGVQRPPWYVQAILGFGAWISALLMIVFVALLLNLAFGVDDPNLVTAAIGLAMFGVGLLIQHRRRGGVFAEQFTLALTAAGAAVAAASIGVQFDDIWAATVAAAVFAAIDIWIGRHAQQQFLLAALAVVLFLAALSDADLPYRIDIAALATPIALWLFLRPVRRELRPLATVLLLTMPFYGIADDATFGPAAESGGWGARILSALCVAALFWLRSRTSGIRHGTPVLAVMAVLGAAICLLLPPGGSAALVILVLAYLLGDRALAIVGVLLQIYFLPRFYFDLELSLLTKSWLLMAVGTLLLVAYAMLVRRRKAGAP